MNKLLKYSFLWLFMLMGVVSANAQDQTLTIADASGSNYFLPYRFDYSDQTQKRQFVIPASEIATMNGSSIKGMKFYTRQGYDTDASGALFSNPPKVDIYLMEVASEELTGFADLGAATLVYSGLFDINSSNEVVLPFTTNYNYGGGNLLVAINTNTVGGWQNPVIEFYGQDIDVANAWTTDNNGTAQDNGYNKFIPKTTFTYEAGSTPVVVIDAPTFNIPAGTVEAGTEVTITGNSDKIIYTTDGTSPSLDNGTVVNGTTATVTINETTTLKAIAADNDGNVSASRSATYTVIVPITKIAQVMEKASTGETVEWTIKDDPSYKIQFVSRNNDGTYVYLWDGARGIILETTGDNVKHVFDEFSTGDVVKGGKLNVYMSSYMEYGWAPTLSSLSEPLVKGENLLVNPIEGDLSTYTAEDRYAFVTAHGTMPSAFGQNMDENNQLTNNFGITADFADAGKTGTFTIVRWFDGNVVPVTPNFFVADPVAAVAVEIGAAGAATFSSTEALDFTGVETVAAYIAKEATSGNSALEFTRVYKVPANTGLIIRNASGEDAGAVIADVPVLADDADDVEGNLFVAAIEEIASLPSEDGEYTNYILNKKNGVLGFYKANNKKVAAGKAYLKVNTGSGAAEFIGFDGEVTAIESLTADKADNEIFDLQGRRVAKAAKGVYIVNGKKVVLK